MRWSLARIGKKAPSKPEGAGCPGEETPSLSAVAHERGGGGTTYGQRGRFFFSSHGIATPGR